PARRVRRALGRLAADVPRDRALPRRHRRGHRARRRDVPDAGEPDGGDAGAEGSGGGDVSVRRGFSWPVPHSGDGRPGARALVGQASAARRRGWIRLVASSALAIALAGCTATARTGGPAPTAAGPADGPGTAAGAV